MRKIDVFKLMLRGVGREFGIHECWALVAGWSKDSFPSRLTKVSSWLGDSEYTVDEYLPARQVIPELPPEIPGPDVDREKRLFGFYLPAGWRRVEWEVMEAEIAPAMREEIAQRVGVEEEIVGLHTAMFGENDSSADNLVNAINTTKRIEYFKKPSNSREIPVTGKLSLDSKIALIEKAIANTNNNTWIMASAKEPNVMCFGDGRGNPSSLLAWGGLPIGNIGFLPYYSCRCHRNEILFSTYNSGPLDAFPHLGISNFRRAFWQLKLEGGLIGHNNLPGYMHINYLTRTIFNFAPEWQVIYSIEPQGGIQRANRGILLRELMSKVLPLSEKVLEARKRELIEERADSVVVSASPSPSEYSIKESFIDKHYFHTLAATPAAAKLEEARKAEELAVTRRKEAELMGGDRYPAKMMLMDVINKEMSLVERQVEAWGVLHEGYTSNFWLFFDTRPLSATLDWAMATLSKDGVKDKKGIKRRIDLGEFRVLLTISGRDWGTDPSVRITRPPGYDEKQVPVGLAPRVRIHPHVNGAIPCLGEHPVMGLNPKNWIIHLLRMGKLAEVVAFLLGYLQSPQVRGAYEPPDNWPSSMEFIEEVLEAVRDGWVIVSGREFMKRGGVDHLVKVEKEMAAKRELGSVKATFRFTGEGTANP